ncbi:hypothetical protein D9M72_230160 [compost metagenome]
MLLGMRSGPMSCELGATRISSREMSLSWPSIATGSVMRLATQREMRLLANEVPRCGDAMKMASLTWGSGSKRR